MRIAIVGGGLAGLAAAMRIAEGGHAVDLFSVVPVKRSHSVCAQGGINGAVNTKGEGDSPWKHFDDTVYGGDFLANQPPVKAMCEMAPSIIYLFDRMGVPFSRTKEGLLDRINVEIELTGPLTEKERATLMDVAAKCPVHRTLKSEINIKLEAARSPNT